MNPLAFLASPAGAVAGDIGGSVISGLFNAREADKVRDWETAMSNTAYQRAAGDMQAAGLNRILALGSPASTPGGPSASVSSPSLGTTSTNARVASQNIAVGKETEKLIKEQQATTAADRALKESQKFQVDSSTALNWASVDLNQANTALSKQNVLRAIQDVKESESRVQLQGAQIPYWSSSARKMVADAEVTESLKGLARAANPWVNWLVGTSEGIFNSARDAAGPIDITPHQSSPRAKKDAQEGADSLLGKGVLKLY